MDKVQAVLKYKFWILFVVALGLATAGYSMTAGKIREETVKKRELIEQTRDSIPPGAGVPNESFATGLQERVADLNERNLEVKRRVWVDQLSAMNWPGHVARYVKPGYRTPLENNAYRRAYEEQYVESIEKLWEVLQPIAGLTEPQKIDVPLAIVPRDASIKENRGTPITSEEMWDAQEDMWFLRSLFESIAAANENSESISDATIRKIMKIRLFGGDGQLALEGAESAADGGYPGGGYGESYGEGYGGGYGGAAAKSIKIDFESDLPQEFGDPGGASGAGDSYGYGSGYPGGGEEGEAPAEPHRYIAYEEGALFRERGFYLSMIVQQDSIPDVLAALSNARWPTRVARFHIGPNPFYDAKTMAAPPEVIGGGGYPGGGYPGGGYDSGGYGGDYGSGSGGYDGGYGSGSGYPDQGYQDGGYGSDYPGGGGGGFDVQGATGAVSDPSVKAALNSPNLVQLDVAGAITMYSPPPEEVLAIARQPVPVQGRPYRIIEEEVTEEQAEEVAEKLTQEAAEADIVAVEAENEERERLKEEAAAEAAEKADAAAGQGEDATDEGDSSPTGDVTSEAAMDDRSGTAGTEAGTEADPEL